MNTLIQLLYFKGCPNADKARENLMSALGQADLERTGRLDHVSLEEVDVNTASTTEEWKGFPSPTILVNGVNIEDGRTQAPGTGGAGSCRLGGAPTIETILKGLKLYGEAGS